MQGQVIEEIESGTVTAQNVWNIDYVNDLLLRDDNSTNGDAGFTGSGLGTRVYYQHDANYNVTATLDASGNVIQRYVYSPYGDQTVLTASWGTSGTSNSIYGFQGGGMMWRQDSPITLTTATTIRLWEPGWKRISRVMWMELVSINLRKMIPL